jgi:hypothetical protein
MFDSAFEKFGFAVHELAASPAGLRQRLRIAVDSVGRLYEEDVPEEMRDEFNELIARITSGKTQAHEGILTATVNQISEEEAVKIVGAIVSFNDDLNFWRGRNWDTHPVTSDIALASTDVH